MAEGTIPQSALNKAAARQRKLAEKGQVRSKGRRVEKVGSIDPVLYYNGIDQGRRMGVKSHNPWDDTDFASEMSREHPEIGDMTGGDGGSGPSSYTMEQARELVSRKAAGRSATVPALQ